jgi:hypothetical protein
VINGFERGTVEQYYANPQLNGTLLASGIENVRLRRDGEDPLVSILFIITAI